MTDPSELGKKILPPLILEAGLRGEKVLLRRFQPSDVADVHRWASDEEISRYMSWEAHTSLKQTEAFICSTIAAYRHEAAQTLALVDVDSMQVVGSVGFSVWSSADARAEIAGALGRPFWGRGMMTEALNMLQIQAFACGLRRIQAMCDPRNVRSQTMLRRLGYTWEGRLRKYTRDQEGTSLDLDMFSLTRS